MTTKTRNQTTVDLDADRGVLIKRTFDAPPRIVFDAWTRADLVRRWWAPKSRGVTIASCDADVRPGGKYRYVIRLEGGEELGFSGTYQEVTAPSKLVYTQVFEPMADGGAAVITVTFEEIGGKTRLTAHEVYPSKEARDAAFSAGMEDGMRETLEQLEALVAGL